MARVTNYILGAGKLFLDLFDDDDQPTGELYLGNSTGIAYSFDEDRESEYASDEFTTYKTDSVVTRSAATISFTLDDIQPEIEAMTLRSSVEQLATIAAGETFETIPLHRGRWHQLGVNAANPTGVRAVYDIRVTSGGPYGFIPAAGNYQVDEALGRIGFDTDGPELKGETTVTIRYRIRASSRETISAASRVLRGSLRYIADNQHGDNFDHYWPLVEVSISDDNALKADSWLEKQFGGVVLKHDVFELHYVDGRASLPSAVYDLSARVNAATTAELGLVKGITISGFDPSDQLVVTMPPDQLYSAWEPAGHNGQALNYFNVIPDEDPEAMYQIGEVEFYPNREAARKAFPGVTLTGASSYTLFILDEPLVDNFGGLSLHIEVE